MKNLIKNPYLITLLSVGFISLLYITLTFTDGDEGRYLYLAEAIANGQGQTDVHLPTPKPEALTPPGYPYLISLFVKNEALTVFWPKALSWLFYLIYSVVILGLFKSFRDLSSKLQVILTLITLLPVSVLIYSWSIFAETIYLLLSGLVLFSVTKEESTMKEAHDHGISYRLVDGYSTRRPRLHPRHWFALPLAQKMDSFDLLCGNLPDRLFTRRIIYLQGARSSLWLHFPLCLGSNVCGENTQLTPHHLHYSAPLPLCRPPPDAVLLPIRWRLFTGQNSIFRFLIRPLTVIAMGLIMVLGFLIRLKKVHFFDLYALVYLPMVSTYHVALQRGIEDRYLLPILPHAVYYLFIGLQFILSKVTDRRRHGSSSSLVPV